MSTKQRGVTLIELIVAIVVIGIAVAGVLLGIGRMTRGSADPMIYAQAQAIAEAYLEEILTRGFSCDGTAESGETRATFDDIGDYHTAPAYVPVADQEGNAVPELGGYAVSVGVACAGLGDIAGADAATITVRVRNAAFGGDVAVLTGYRTRR